MTTTPELIDAADNYSDDCDTQDDRERLIKWAVDEIQSQWARDRRDAELITSVLLWANGWKAPVSCPGLFSVYVDAVEVWLYLSCASGEWVLSDGYDNVIATIKTMGDVRRFVEAFRGIVR